MFVLLQLINSIKSRPIELKVLHSWFEDLDFETLVDEIESNFLMEPLRETQVKSLERIINNGSWKSAFAIHGVK
jgi:hypothetical protein